MRYAILVVVLQLWLPNRILACTEDMPVRHQLRMTGDDVVALADPERGRVIRLATTGPSELVANAEFTHRDAAFTSDGQTMFLVREDYSDPERGAACMATFVFVERVDLRTGVRTTIRRLRSTGAAGIEIAPDDRHLLVMAGDVEGEYVVHLFEIASGRRVRVTRDIDAAFLDGNTLLIRGLDNRLRIAGLDGRTLARVPAAAGGDYYRLLPGHSSAVAFTIVRTRTTGEEGFHPVDVIRTGTQLRLHESRGHFVGRPLMTTADGTRVLVATEDGHRVRLTDRQTGATYATIRGAYDYTAATVSADGATIAVVSIARFDDVDATNDLSASQPTTIERFSIPSGTRQAWGVGFVSVFAASAD